MSPPVKQKKLSPDLRTSPRRRPQTSSSFIRPLPPAISQISPIRTSPRRRPLTVETTQKPGPKPQRTSSSPRRRLNFDEQPVAASTPSSRVQIPNKRVLLVAQKQTYPIKSVQTSSSSVNKRPADQSDTVDVPPPKKRAMTTKNTSSNEIASSAVPSRSTRTSPRKSPRKQKTPIPHQNANLVASEVVNPDDGNWVIYTISHPSTFQQEIRNGSGNLEQVSKTMLTLAKKSGFLPQSIDRSHPLLFSISQKENDMDGQLILSGSRYKLPREKKEFSAVKLTFKGSIAKFLSIYAEPNNVFLLFGRMLDSRSALEILPEKKHPRIFCFVLREMQQQQPAKINYPSVSTIDCPIYSNAALRDDPTLDITPGIISQVLITYPKFTMDGEKFIPWDQELLRQQQEMLGQNIVEDDDEDFVQLEIRSNNNNNQENVQRPRTVSVFTAPGRRRNEKVDALLAKSSSRRSTQGQLDSSEVVFERARPYNPPLGSSPRRPVIDINRVGQSEAVHMVLENHYFVEGQSRPKLEKVRSSSYYYEKLRELKDQLERLTIDQFQRGEVPDATLLEEKFIYGLVVSLFSPGQTEKNYYRVYISDETLENIPLRLCTSKADHIKGPELKIGDIVRVHRARVQMEFDAVRDKQGMTISTAPHRNYTVFRRDPSDRHKIIYDSAANTVRHSDSDIKIIQKLFELAKDRIHEDIPNDLFDSQWDGNTTVNRAIDVRPNNNNATTSNPVRPHLGITQFYDPPSLPSSPSIIPYCSSSEDMEIDNNEEEQSSAVNTSNNNQRRTSPRFHVPPFGFQS